MIGRTHLGSNLHFFQPKEPGQTRSLSTFLLAHPQSKTHTLRLESYALLVLSWACDSISFMRKQQLSKHTQTHTLTHIKNRIKRRLLQESWLQQGPFENTCIATKAEGNCPKPPKLKRTSKHWWQKFWGWVYMYSQEGIGEGLVLAHETATTLRVNLQEELFCTKILYRFR